MKPPIRRCLFCLVTLWTGCYGPGAADWPDAAVLFRTAEPPMPRPALTAEVRRFFLQKVPGGLVPHPALSPHTAAFLESAGLPAPGRGGVIPEALLFKPGRLAEAAARASDIYLFNYEGSRRYGFRGKKPDGSFDLSPGPFFRTGRPLDFAVDDPSGRRFFVLVPANAPTPPDEAHSFLTRAVRMFQRENGPPQTSDGFTFMYLPSGKTGASPAGPASLVPAWLEVPEDAELRSEDGVRFRIPASLSLKSARPARFSSGILEGPNVDFRQLSLQARLASEIQGLLQAVVSGTAARPGPERFIVGSGLPSTGDFLARKGIAEQQKPDSVILRLRHTERHREALLYALSALRLKMDTASENLRHIGETAKTPSELYVPKTVVFSSSENRFEVKPLSSEPQKIYAPKDPNADDEGFVYAVKTVPQAEIETFRSAAEEYEILRRVVERAFPEVVLPKAGDLQPPPSLPRQERGRNAE